MHKKVWATFSRYIRLRDAIKTTGEPYELACVTCSRRVPIKESDAGHFQPRRWKATLYHEQNVHGQCKACNNKDWNQGEQYKHGKAIDRMYGDGTADHLEALSRELKQFKVYELEELYDEFKGKLQALEDVYGEMWA